MLINKHHVKAAYFKLMHLWKHSQNRWRHCKIVSFCMNAVNLWCPWTTQQYICKLVSSLGRVKIKIYYSYNETVMVAILVMASLSTENWLSRAFYKRSSHLTYYWVILWSMSACAPLKWDWSHFTTLHFNIYPHQSTATVLKILMIKLALTQNT